MAGRKVPHRHLTKRAQPLHCRDVNEVALYFKELRQFSAMQSSLDPSVSIKALPDGAQSSGAGNGSDRTTGASQQDDEPRIKLNYDPKAKRRPGQILKLHATFSELTSKDGAKIGWVDAPGPRTEDELRTAIEKSKKDFKSRKPVILRQYKKNEDGKLTGEVSQEIRVKQLGRSVGSTIGRVSTQAFQAAGGIIDANGKLRCPPGTPNANQFTDLDMSNCMVLSVRGLIGSVRRIKDKFDKLAEIGSDIAKFGRELTDFEKEQQGLFEKTRTAVTSVERVVEVATSHAETISRILSDAGISLDDTLEGGNVDLLLGIRSRFPDSPDGDEQFKAFLFGATDGDRRAGTSVGGIFADVGEVLPGGVGFEYQGDLSPESLQANLRRYDELIRQKIKESMPDDIQAILDDPDAPAEVRDAAQKLVDRVRERHHIAQREFLGTHMVFQDQNPEAAARVGQLKAVNVLDLDAGERLIDIEGFTKPAFDDNGDLSVVIGHNPLAMALTSAYGAIGDLFSRDTDLSDGTWYIDVGDVASEAERLQETVRVLTEISDAMTFAESVGYANDTSGARLASALGTDAVLGRSRHVAWHEIGHALQYHAVQQKIIDRWKTDGVFTAIGPDGGLVQFEEAPSLWTNEQWVLAHTTLFGWSGDELYDFPPKGAHTFEKSLVNLFAGKYYQGELAKAQNAMAQGRADLVPQTLRTALMEGSVEVFAQRQMGIIEGEVIDDSIAWFLPETMTYDRASDIPYYLPPMRDVEDIPGPDAPDIPTSGGPPREGGGNVTIYNGPVINGPINITIINGPQVASEMDEPTSTIDVPEIDGQGNPVEKVIKWTDISGHIYLDEETQWSPTSPHNIPLEQNPDEIRRIVDAAFGFGPDKGGPDPDDSLGFIRQQKDAYWKMGPEQLDARYESLRDEFIRLRDKSLTEPLSSDEQTRMWLAMKGMRQVLDVNARKSKMSDADVESYELRGFDPRPGRYMRDADTLLKPQQKRFRQYAIDRRTSRGFDDIEIVDDDELSHWSREIASHVGDVPEGKEGFDGSLSPYDRSNIRNTRGLSVKEKRRRSPEYQPTQEEIDTASPSLNPELYGERQISSLSQRATDTERSMLEVSDRIEKSPIVESMSSFAATGSNASISKLLENAAQVREDQRRIGYKPTPGDENSFLADNYPELLKFFGSLELEQDMSVVSSISVDERLEPGTIIEHGGPLRGLLVSSEASDAFTFAQPQNSQRAIIMMPKGSKGMHSKNAHNGDADGMLIPPGSLEVLRVEPDGTVVLTPNKQKSTSELIDDAILAIDSVVAAKGSPVAGEKRRLKSMLLAQKKATDVPSRSTRGASGDMSTHAKSDLRVDSIQRGFLSKGSDFFGTTPKNGSTLPSPSQRDGLLAEADSAFESFSQDWKGRFLAGEFDIDWVLPEHVKGVDSGIYRFHEAFDDRPRIFSDVDSFGEFLDTGVLSNTIQRNPNSLIARRQKDFEKIYGLSDDVPDASRSHFGHMVHGSSIKEIQDYLDELPRDGMIRESRFFSDRPGINEFGDLKSGGRTIEFVLTPETAKRTAYTRGNPMDMEAIPVPVLSNEPNAVRAALLRNSITSNDDTFLGDIYEALDMVRTGSMSNFGRGGISSRSSRSDRPNGPTFGAVIGGGITSNDVSEIKIDVSKLDLLPLSADDIGGRDKLIRMLSDAGIRGDVDAVLDALLAGESIDELPREARFLHTSFARIARHKAAVAYVEKNKTHFGDDITITITNPDGIDLTNPESFLDLPHISKDADISERLSERLRYDIYGSKMRTLKAGSAERELYYQTGSLNTSDPRVMYTRPGAMAPGETPRVDGPVRVRDAGQSLEFQLGKANSKGFHSVLGPDSPGFDESSLALIEYNPQTRELVLVSKRTGQIAKIDDVDAMEAIQLSMNVDDSGNFDTIDAGIQRILRRDANRKLVSEADGKPLNPSSFSKFVSPVDVEADAREELRTVFPGIDDFPDQKFRGGGTSSRSTRGTANRSRSSDLFEQAVSLGDASDPNGGLHTLGDDELLEKFGAERTGLISVSDNTPVLRVNDVESAAALIAAGYHVELGDGAKPEQLVGSSAKLQKEIDSIIPELRKKYGRDDAGFGTIDTCRLYKAGTNIFCEGGLGTFREDMPQLSGRARGDDARVVAAMKGGAVKVDWKSGRRSPDGTLEKLTPEEKARFDDLKARHAKPGSPGDLSSEELEEFYSLVDWNDTEADLMPEFKEFVRSATGRDDAITRQEGLKPSDLSASQGQIQMGKTGGMVISMQDHDASFRRYMEDAFPDVAYGTDEYYDHRDAWLYKGQALDGSTIRMPMYNAEGKLIDGDGNLLPEGAEPFYKEGKPWFTGGSIISTTDGFVVDGHHRWASFMAFNEGKPEREQLRINSEVMDMPIDDALSIGKVVQDHWGIKPAVLGQETYFKGDASQVAAMDAGQIADEMSEIQSTLPEKLKEARKLYVQKEGFGSTVDSRARDFQGGGVRVQREGSSRSLRERIGRKGRNGDTTPPAKRSAKDKFEDAISLGAHDDSLSGLHALSDEELSTRFSATRTDMIAASDDQPIYRVDDVDSAAALLAAGYHVELGDNAKPKKLVKASNKLQKDIDKVIPELRKKYGRDDAGFGTIDTCRLYKAGTNIFCKGGLGTFREDMPQLSGRARGEDTLVAKAMKGGLVKTDWRAGRRGPDGSLTNLTPDEKARFDELSARHAKPGSPGDLSPEELSEFYSLVDWNDTEADLMPEFRKYVTSVTGRENAITRIDGADPEAYNASQGQIQMGKTAGMVISMENHDYSFSRWMSENHPDIAQDSDAFYEWRNAWLYGTDSPDGSSIEVPLYDVDGTPLDKAGNPMFGADGEILKDAQPATIKRPWFTSGSIITTKDGFVVDGHHRWASFVAYNEDLGPRAKLKINTEEMDMPIDEALSIGKVMQDHWGIKPAVLGRETYFVGDGASTPSLTPDELESSISTLIDEAPSRLPAARELYMQKEGFGFTERRMGKVQGGGVRVQREQVGSGPSSRSSRSAPDAFEPKTFADEYPMMSRIGITPRPDDGNEDSSILRSEAEQLMRGASAAEMKRAERIARDAYDEVQSRREATMAAIAEELGSPSAIDDLMDFTQPTPREWLELSEDRKLAISDMLAEIQQFETERFNAAKDEIYEARRLSRLARTDAIEKAKSTANDLTSRSTRSSAIQSALPLEKIGSDLASAFANRGSAGVMSQLRKMLRNDGSGWAIDYAKERGYISDQQANILKKLAKGAIKRFVLPKVDARKKARAAAKKRTVRK